MLRRSVTFDSQNTSWIYSEITCWYCKICFWSKINSYNGIFTFSGLVLGKIQVGCVVNFAQFSPGSYIKIIRQDFLWALYILTKKLISLTTNYLPTFSLFCFQRSSVVTSASSRISLISRASIISSLGRNKEGKTSKKMVVCRVALLDGTQFEPKGIDVSNGHHLSDYAWVESWMLESLEGQIIKVVEFNKKCI